MSTADTENPPSFFRTVSVDRASWRFSLFFGGGGIGYI